MRNKLKIIGHIVEPWCCLSSQLGPSIQLMKHSLSLGAALHTAAAGASAGQQGPRAACASAALGNESRFWTFLVSFILKGRGQAQHLECFDRCHL